MSATIQYFGTCLLLATTGCASHPDHFYTLNALPAAVRAPLPERPIHVLLSVSVPALVDRTEMVLEDSGNGILVLDHERWAVPLSDAVAQALSRDIENHRADIVVGDRSFDQGASPPVTIKVDIVRMSARRGGKATLEAHWHIVDAGAGIDKIGGAAADLPIPAKGYADVAEAFGQALDSLAAQLTTEIRPR